MADGLQTFNGAVQIVSLSRDVYLLVQKIRNAKPEAQKWLDKVANLRILAGEIQNMLRARAAGRGLGHDASQDEIRIEAWLKASVCRCKQCLVQMKSKLLPLRDIGPNFDINSLPERIRFVFDIDFIRTQQKELKGQVQNISVALHLLDYYDRRRDRALAIETVALLREILTQSRSRGTGVSTEDDDDEQFSSAIQTPVEGHPLLPAEQPTDTQFPVMDLDDVNSVDDDEGLLQRLSGSDSEDDSLDLENQSRERVLRVTDQPLMIAVEGKQLERVRGLLSNTSDDEVRVYDKDEWTVLHHAVLRNSPDMLNILLQQPQLRAPEYLNKQNRQRQTALMDAAKRADRKQGLKMVKLLLGYNAEVNILDDAGRGALHWVVDRPPDPTGCSDEAAKLLLDKGAKVKPLDSTVEDQQLKKYPGVRRESLETSNESKKPRRSWLKDTFTGQ
ncbi:hypothetical protein LTR70_006652 [Exophiala xenobiotica]|uniref:Uncharacterized protein n=1 Tax=Lithohypha guttulata TaxID=1690604 RepID=A0ABR0KNI3_9EURO|nr:hypothetical protein LTR24_000349 [Lithohypha guttulata]KAK5315661.1 hypothetical protein LTR70_006652 [Exophiala xenobiotica]